MPRLRSTSASHTAPPGPGDASAVRRGLRRLFEDRRVLDRRLQAAVDELPLAVRLAMLDGVRFERIIVGAYTDGQRGVCPMLAAHRRGARVSFLPFAKAWDAYAAAPIRGHRDAAPAAVAHLAAVLRCSIEADLRTPLEPRHRPAIEVGALPRPDDAPDPAPRGHDAAASCAPVR